MDQRQSDYTIRDLLTSFHSAIGRFFELMEQALEQDRPAAQAIAEPEPTATPEPILDAVASEEPYRIEDCHSFYILDKNGERIAGADVFKRHGVLHLTNLHTHPDHRRKGLANKIMRTVIKHYPDEVIHLNVWSYGNRPLDDYRLIEFYKKWGFGLVLDGGGKMIRQPKAQWSSNR